MLRIYWENLTQYSFEMEIKNRLRYTGRQGYDFTEDTTPTWLQNFHIFVYLSKFYSLKVKIKGLQMITKNDNVRYRY